MVDLSGREYKFLQMICAQTGGDVSRIVVSGRLNQLAGTNGFDEQDVFHISNLLYKLELLIMRAREGEKTAAGANVVECVKLTSRGREYVQSLE